MNEDDLLELNSFIEKSEAYLELVRKRNLLGEASFNKNLLAFEKYFPEIYKQVKEFNLKIAKSKLFITKQGYYNILPSGSDYPLYSENPLDDAIKQVLEETSNLNLFASRVSGKVPSDDKRAHMILMREITNLVRLYKQKKPTEKQILNKHHTSLMLFGVGLGYHLQVLNEKHTFDYSFICEPDFELFYYSLYNFDWASYLAEQDEKGNFIFIQVGVDYEDYLNELLRIAQDIGPHLFVSSFVLQHYPSADLNKLIESFLKNTHRLLSGFGFYNDAINGLAHYIENVKRGAKYLKLNSIKRNKIDHLPVFVIGNGPSLDDSIDYIRENQDRAVIIAAGTALQTLIKYDIVPDFHVLVERTKTTYDVLVNTLPHDVYKKLKLLTVDVMHPDVIPLYSWVGLGLKGPECATYFSNLVSLKTKTPFVASLKYSGPVVSNTALSYALYFGFKEIYMFGVDNGTYNSSTHSKLSIYSDKQYNLNATIISDAKHELEGNFGEQVITNDLLAVSKSEMESLISSYRSDKVSIYKVGLGAKLEGTFPVKVNDLLSLRALDKSHVINHITSNYFDTFTELNIEDYFDQELYINLLDRLIEISTKEVRDVKEFSELIKLLHNEVFSTKKTRYEYVSKILSGTFYYYSYIALAVAYSYEGDELIKLINSFNKEWISFLFSVKGSINNDLKVLCNIGLEIID